MTSQPAASTARTDETTAARRASVTAAHRRSVRQTAEFAFWATWYIGVWFWGITILIGGLTWYFMQRGGGVEIGAVAGPMASAPYFLLVMGIVLPLSMIALHLSAGGTRRSLAHGLAWGGTAVGVTFGLAAAVAGWLMWWAAARAGWDLPSGADQPTSDLSEIGLALLVQSVFCTVYFLAGVALSIGFYRAGWWRGSLFLLAALVPLTTAELSLQTRWLGRELAAQIGLPELPVWAGLLGGLLAVGLAGLLIRQVVRNVAIRPVASVASGSYT